MATIFVNSNATGANDGTTWADAYTSLASGISALSPNDNLIIANTHSESVGAATYSPPEDVNIITSTVSGTSTVTEIAAVAAQITATGNSDIHFSATDGVSIYGMFLSSGGDTFFSNVRTERCRIEIGNGTQNQNFIGPLNIDSGWESWHDRRINKSTTAIESVVAVPDQRFAQIYGGTIESDRTSTSTSHTCIQASSISSVIMDGVDCSGFQLQNFATIPSGNNTFFQATNIKLNAATTNLVDVADTSQGAKIIIDAVDDADNQRIFRNEYRGQVNSNASIYIDDTSALSNQSISFTTNTRNMDLTSPLRVQIFGGIADFSTPKTLTVEIAQDGTTTNLTDAEAWIEVQYPLANNATAYDDDRAANTPAAANQTASTATWTGLSGTNARQKCEVTTTQTGVEGLYKVYFCIAKPSATVYVNPEAQVS